MKKVILFLFLILINSFISCSNDSDDSTDSNPTPGNADSSLLIGEWELIEFRADNITSVMETPNGSNTVNFSLLGKDITTVMTISENPNLITSVGSQTTVISFVVNEENIIQEIPGEEFDMTGPWSLDGDELTFSNAGDIEQGIGTITELTNETLNLSLMLNEVMEFENGTTTTNTGLIIYKFLRK